MGQKKDENFDVAVGSFHGAESCELVGLMILNELNSLGLNLGIYRDDGLGIMSNAPRECEKIKQKITKIFNENNLKITIEANQSEVNFLDVTFNI